jgi:dephospho-CoA kinase
MIILGVTGSIGTGKSFFCRSLAREKGVRVLSSDAEVHRLYAFDKELVKHIEIYFPTAVKGGKIDRQILGAIVFNDREKKHLLESIVYPLLKKRRNRFLNECRKRKVKLAVLEIPLLFENNLDVECHYTLTLYCSKLIQRSRVVGRGMSEEKFNLILETQMPSHEKIRLSDYHMNTGRSKNFTARLAKKMYLELISQKN